MSFQMFNELKSIRAQLLELLQRIEALEEKTAKFPPHAKNTKKTEVTNNAEHKAKTLSEGFNNVPA